MTLVPETPVQKKDCIVDECTKAPKGFKTSRGLKNHMKKFHNVVLDAFSPIATTTRVLFDSSSETPSVQGNSKGQVNYPNIVSEGTIQCGQCPEIFRNRDNVKKHMDEEHDKADAAKTKEKPVDNNRCTQNSEVLNNDRDDEEDLVEIMEDIEDGNIAEQIEKGGSV